MKNLLIAFSLLSLFSIGCGKSACEESFDISVDSCGATEDQRDLTVGICEALDQDQVQSCLDCTNGAADPCTANAVGGPCETECTFTL